MFQCRPCIVFLALALVPAVARATDPDRMWATYFGGESVNVAEGIAVDGTGNIYVTGFTTSKQQIATPGTHQQMYSVGTGGPDAFLLKFAPDGTRLWGTYLGGPGHDYGYGVAADATGNTVIFGWTYSPSGIATDGAVQVSQTPPGPGDGFVVAFDPDGKRKWGTYIGSTIGKDPDDENATRAAAFDAAGNVYVAGHTPGPLAFALPGGFKADFTQAFQDPCDAYLIKFSPDGALLWGTYYGDVGDDRGLSVAVRDPDIVYLSGITSSAANIATAGTHDEVYANSSDGFVVRFDADGERQWASYFGGTSEEADQRAAVTPTGELYVAGRTHSSSGIATPGAFKAYKNTMGDAYLARFATDGKLEWGTYYGYDGADGMSVDVASDAAGNALFAGNTMSETGFAGIDPYQQTNMGFRDFFLAKFTPAGKRRWGTYLGGTLHEETLNGKLVAAPGTDIVYLAGGSRSAGMASPGAFQEVAASGFAGLLVRFTQHEISSPCADQADCKAGTCVDGVCCDAACGGGVADDCQTCLLADGAVADGICTVQSAAVVCRPGASACDVAESCPGDAAGCPADELAADDTPCDDGVCAAGVCLPGADSSSGGPGETTGTDPTAGPTTTGTTTGATTGTTTGATTIDDPTAGTSTISEPTTTTPTETSASPTVTGGDPTSTSAATAGTTGDDTAGTAGGGGSSDGCSCAQGHGERGMLLAAAVLLALPRRRRR